MDRLIYKEADGDLTCRSRDFDKVFPTLYAYEETGLTPEQVNVLSTNLDAMTGLAKDLTDKLEQVRNERDRLHELWAKIPDTIKAHLNCICAGEFAEEG